MRNCIDNYLQTFDIRLETCEQNYRGHINGTMTLCKGHIHIGKLQYNFDGKDLTIESVKITRHKKNIYNNNFNVKFMEVLFLYLLTLYIDKGASCVKLNADPTYGQDVKENKGRESCLMCYYEKLGFKPNIDQNQKYYIKKYVNLCKKYNIYPNDEKLSIFCSLCDCQKKNLLDDLGFKLVFDELKVEMSRLIPNLANALKDALKEMKCYK